MTPSVFWLIVFVLFTVGEAATVGLASIWFALGALATLISVGFGAGITMQAVVFISVTALSMLVFRPLVQKVLKPNHQATNANRLIGTTALVTVTIDNIVNQGEVQVPGQLWSAISVNDMVIPEKSKVRVLEIKGAKLLVELLPQSSDETPEEPSEEISEESTL